MESHRSMRNDAENRDNECPLDFIRFELRNLKSLFGWFNSRWSMIFIISDELRCCHFDILPLYTYVNGRRSASNKWMESWFYRIIPTENRKRSFCRNKICYSFAFPFSFFFLCFLSLFLLSFPKLCLFWLGWLRFSPKSKCLILVDHWTLIKRYHDSFLAIFVRFCHSKTLCVHLFNR